MKYTGGDILFTMTGVGSVFVYDRAQQRAHEIPELIAAMLSRTGAMATLDEHADSLCQRLRMPASQRDAVRAHLGELAEAGLLVSEHDLRDWAMAGAEPGSAPGATCGPIATAAILACGDDARLRAALGSLLGTLARHERGSEVAVEVAVIDDARDEAARARCRQAAAALAQDQPKGLTVTYAGAAERRRFGEALVAAGADARAVERALFDVHAHGFSPGIGRNALLLHTAGTTCYAADDDTLAEIAGPDAPGGIDAVLALSNRDPTALWLYADREAAWADAARADVDILACHELLLGKDPGTCLSDLDAATGTRVALDMDGMRPPWFRRLCTGGRVAVTTFGVVGDCGLDGNGLYLLQEGASLARLVDGDAPYLVLRDSREVRRVAPRCTLTSSPMFSATAAAYDNRELLPPFVPVGRGEDASFGVALRACLARGVIAHLPWAIRHEPAPRGRFAADDIWQSAGVLTINQAMMLLMGALELPAGAGEPEDRLRALGAHLEQAARLPLPAFEDMLQAERLRRLSGLISLREQLLTEHADAAPEAWAHDMEQSIDALRAACAVGALPVAVDLGERMAEEQAREALRTHVGDYGLLLQAWPEMMQAARALREDGNGLTRPAGA